VQKIGLFILTVILFFSFQALGQESPVITNRSNTVHRIEGKEYFFHAVLQGQTLFSIARAYGVTVDDITRENPDLRGELKYDQIIRIPVKQFTPGSDQPKSMALTEITFTEHQVKRRETLYGISRQYNISESDLVQHNPQAKSGLRSNMMLRIPRYLETTIFYKDHVVLPRQTLFSITREFGISIADLEAINPELKDGLKAGQILKIPIDHTPPVQPPFVQESTPQLSTGHDAGRLPVLSDPYCSNPQIKNHYNVALLIPLYLDNFTEEGFLSPQAHENSFRFLEYYEGILIALDSIRARGGDIRLTVYDVAEDEAKARAAIWKPELARMDLIIGPFFPKVFPIVANFAKDKNIPIVSPFSSDDREIIRKYPLMFQATPDLLTQMKDMAAYIVDTYPEDNIVIVHNNQPGVINLISSYKMALNDGLNLYQYRRDSSHMAKLDGYFLNGVYVGERVTNVYVINDSLRRLQKQTGSISDVDYRKYEGKDNVKEVVFSNGGMNAVKRNLDRSRRNIVVTLMGGEANIANYTRQLNHLRDSFDITVFGVPQWRDYRSVDLTYLQRLNTHIFSTEFIDYDRVNNIEYIKRFSSINGVEPGVMGFRAVETGMFFFNALMQYGAEFYRCMDKINESQGASTPFVFKKPFDNSGWENHFVFIYRHENFSLRDMKEARRRMVIQGR
jgi:LysM repeat protein